LQGEANEKTVNKFLSGLDPNAKGLLIAAVSLGSFLAFIPASYVADNFGRRLCVAIGSTLVIAASIIQVAVQQHWIFFGARVVTGIGVGFSQTAAPLLIAETAHPRQRRTLTGLYNAVWFIGSITAAGIAFSTLSIHNSWSWRVPCMLQVFYPVFQLTGLFFVPESPRWLVSKDRKADALAMLIRFHANGNPDDKLVRDEYDQICSSISAEAHMRSASRWSTFFKTKGNLHRLAICILLGFMQEWTGNGMISIYQKYKKHVTNKDIRCHFLLPPSYPRLSRHPRRRPPSRGKHQSASVEPGVCDIRRKHIRQIRTTNPLDQRNHPDADLPVHIRNHGRAIRRNASTGSRNHSGAGAIPLLCSL
jgi:hypothetical protein